MFRLYNSIVMTWRAVPYLLGPASNAVRSDSKRASAFWTPSSTASGVSQVSGSRGSALTHPDRERRVVESTLVNAGHDLRVASPETCGDVASDQLFEHSARGVDGRRVNGLLDHRAPGAIASEGSATPSWSLAVGSDGRGARGGSRRGLRRPRGCRTGSASSSGGIASRSARIAGQSNSMCGCCSSMDRIASSSSAGRPISTSGAVRYQ